MASNNQGRDAQEGDDDFEDFGGFEAADPVPDMPAAQAQAAASPWAMFNTGNATGQPDLLCAQNRFPNYLDPSGITGPGGGAQADVNLNNATGNPPDLPQADLLSGQLLGNILDVNPANRNPINGRLPDIGLGTNENRMFGQANGFGSLDSPSGDNNEGRIDHGPAPPLELPNGAMALPHPVEGAALDSHHVSPQDRAVAAELQARGDHPIPAVADVVGGAGGGGGGAAAAGIGEHQGPGVPDGAAEIPGGVGNAGESVFQQRLAALAEENTRLEEELSRCREELASQRSRLEEVETRHHTQLEEVRRAGHDALAVVVEQYKEQSKAVVLEQQEQARQHIAQVVREQIGAFQDLLQAQQDIQEQKKKEDKEELERQLAQALEQSRLEQEEKFQLFLTEEREKQRAATEKALEDERTASREKVQESIDAEIERGKARLEEARSEAMEKLDEERRNHETALVSVREAEKRLAQEEMAQLAREERERSREVTREAVAASRLESQAYLQEQRQADSRVRQRHLASLDLFLESSRQQIALLMESERHNPSAPQELSAQSSSSQAGASASPAAGKPSSERPPPPDTSNHEREAGGS